MNQSLWQKHRRRHFAPVKADGQYDVVVIGGGITGLSAAYFLTVAGQSVCLVGAIASGAGDTGHTTAHLTAVTDLRLEKLVKSFGQQAANLVWQAGRAAIDAIESIVVEHGIHCEFQRIPGFLHASLLDQKDETKSLQAEARLATQLGIHAQFVDNVPYVGKPGICFPDQAKFDPLAYLAGLAEFLATRGCAIHEQSEVTEVEAKPMAVKVGKNRIACNYLVSPRMSPCRGSRVWPVPRRFKPSWRHSQPMPSLPRCPLPNIHLPSIRRSRSGTLAVPTTISGWTAGERTIA